MDIDAMLILFSVFIYRAAHVMSTNLFFIRFLSDIPRNITAFCNHNCNSFVYLVKYKFESEVCSYTQQAVMYITSGLGFPLCTTFIIPTFFHLLTHSLMISLTWNCFLYTVQSTVNFTGGELRGKILFQKFRHRHGDNIMQPMSESS
jgi:hypothetical protein